MGNIIYNSTADLHSYLDEVARKHKWHIGLVIDVHNLGQYIVTDIEPFTGSLPLNSDTLYIYKGDQLIGYGEGTYSITIKKIPETHVGGHNRRRPYSDN